MGWTILKFLNFPPAFPNKFMGKYRKILEEYPVLQWVTHSGARDVTRQWLHQVWFLSDWTRERSRRKLAGSRRYKGSRCRNWGQSWEAPDCWKQPGIFGIRDWHWAREKTWLREGQLGLCSRRRVSQSRSTPRPTSSPRHSEGTSVWWSVRFASPEQVSVSKETQMKSRKE